MARRQCAFCGTFVDEDAKQCPDCREMIPARIKIQTVRHGWAEIRRGLVLMLLATGAFYLASPQSKLPLPFAIPQAVTTYLLPAVFVLGLGFAVYGIARRIGLV